MPALSPLMTVLHRAVEKAAKTLLRDFNEVEHLQVSIKGPGDFVTAADRKAEQTLFQELSRARPNFGFLMEESGAVGPKDAEFKFIIDPLDGTTNFLHGIPHWAISVGVEKDGEVIAGVVYDPVKQEMFHAEKGGGAWINNDRRVRVSGRKELDRAMIGTYYGVGKGPHTFDQVNILREKKISYRISGCAALDLAYLACGRLDGVVHKTLNPWDVAAGILFVKESGGKVIGLEHPQDPLNSPGIFAANLHLFDPLRKVLGV